LRPLKIIGERPHVGNLILAKPIGLDPSQQKRLAKIAAAAQQTNTFRTIADELLVQKRREGKAPSTMAKLEWLLGLARPALGTRPISAITAPEVLQVLRAVESRERLETAHRLRAFIGSIFRFASGDRTGVNRSNRSPPWSINHADRAPPRGDS
jgi:integrase